MYFDYLIGYTDSYEESYGSRIIIGEDLVNNELRINPELMISPGNILAGYFVDMNLVSIESTISKFLLIGEDLTNKFKIGDGLINDYSRKIVFSENSDYLDWDFHYVLVDNYGISYGDINIIGSCVIFDSYIGNQITEVFGSESDFFGTSVHIDPQDDYSVSYSGQLTIGSEYIDDYKISKYKENKEFSEYSDTLLSSYLMATKSKYSESFEDTNLIGSEIELNSSNSGNTLIELYKKSEHFTSESDNLSSSLDINEVELYEDAYINHNLIGSGEIQDKLIQPELYKIVLEDVQDLEFSLTDYQVLDYEISYEEGFLVGEEAIVDKGFVLEGAASVWYFDSDSDTFDIE